MNAVALPRQTQTFLDKLDQQLFTAIYNRSLVYNTCWEDPAVDRKALSIGPSDTILVITSAGCNALDYALLGPARIHAVDANPRQNALLELKLASIRKLEYADFFDVFGRGWSPRFREIYRDALRAELSPFAREWWDKHHGWFESPVNSFYYHGLSGIVARAFRAYLKMRPQLREPVFALFDTGDVEAQRRIYDERIRPVMWTRSLNWMLSRQLTMSFLGVPFPQRKQVEIQHENGVAGFIREAVEYVFRELPVSTNYFWSVYVRGGYTPACCPEYLKPGNFMALKAGLADRVKLHTCTVTDFLHATEERISKFVLLDHMDWMSSYYPDLLLEEWDAIEARATPGARVILRSAHRRPEYLRWVTLGPERRPLRSVVAFDDALAENLTREDRVHTYAGFHIGHFAA